MTKAGTMVDVAVSPQPVQRLHDLTSQSQEDGCSDECDLDPSSHPYASS